MSRRRCLGGDRPTPKGGPVPQETKRHTAVRYATAHLTYGVDRRGCRPLLGRGPLALGSPEVGHTAVAQCSDAGSTPRRPFTCTRCAHSITGALQTGGQRLRALAGTAWSVPRFPAGGRAPDR